MTTLEKERKTLLKKELREYKKYNSMTEEEKKLLHEWVEEGNSVHENGSFVCHNGGQPVDFLEVYREEEQIRQKFNALCVKEREQFLRELRGEPSIEDLKELNAALSLKADAYGRTLKKYGYQNEADDLCKEWCKSFNFTDAADAGLPFRQG